jgi:hypothetical protein
MPRRQRTLSYGLRPWFGLRPETFATGSLNPVGQARTRGRAQILKCSVTARHSHRLTSGGEADHKLLPRKQAVYDVFRREQRPKPL